MNDRPDNPSPDETPEIAEVRRLLAEARHSEPMPDDVAARMSRTLDRLGDETPAAPPAPRAGAVIPIAAHRRRRAAGLLAAAAAIVVGGVVVQNVDLSSGSGGDATTTAEDAPAGSDSGLAPGNLGKSGQDSHSPTTPMSGSQPVKAPVTVHPRRFAVDAMKARQLLGTAYGVEDRATETAECTDLPRHARAVPATYKRASAALVFRQPEGSAQVVELFICGSSTPIRSTTLPVP